MSDGFAMELCGTQGSYQIVPDDVETIDLDAVGAPLKPRVLRSGCALVCAGRFPADAR